MEKHANFEALALFRVTSYKVAVFRAANSLSRKHTILVLFLSPLTVKKSVSYLVE